MVGEIVLDTPEVLADFVSCTDDAENTGLSTDGTPALGRTISARLDTPRPTFGLVRPDLAALLQFPQAHVIEPANYYLWRDRYFSADAAVPDSNIDQYRRVLVLVEFLKGSAAFLDDRAEVLVFIREGRFDVPVKYTPSQVAQTEFVALEQLTTAVIDEVHKSQRQSILAESIYEVLSKHPVTDRFAHLLKALAEVQDRFERGYRMFATGFSYEKLRDQVEAARIEYTSKMHKVFSDIQNQLLGIPVATVIVATQMKASEKLSSDFWVSVAVLLGSFVFALLVHLLLRNQRHTLEVIGLEINRQKKEMEGQPQALAVNFLPTFQLLDDRYRVQMRILLAIDYVLILGVAMSLFFFYILSGPVRRWVDTVLGFF